MKRYSFILLAGLLSLLPTLTKAMPAEVTSDGSTEAMTWHLENDRMRLDLSYSTGKGIALTELFCKEADTKIAGTNSRLFEYFMRQLPRHQETNTKTMTLRSGDAAWELQSSDVQDIRLSAALPDSVIGKRLTVSLAGEDVAIALCFELYNDGGGLRYQTIIRNLNEDCSLLIERATVLKLDVANKSHNLHYVMKSQWESTRGTLAEPAVNNKGNDVGKLLLCLYDSGYGWYMAPETNWKTQYGPEVKDDQSSPSYTYMLRPFAVSTAWANGNSDGAKVLTCPESFQLMLRPGEAFEFIAVNITTFKGDIVDGKMAVEEHLRRRFRYHHTTTSLMINDWDWFTSGLRTENFFYNTVLPLAKQGGYDMLLIDDGWNNAAGNGTKLRQDGTSRDPITSNTPGIPDMKTFSEHVRAEGLKLGLWYSNSGGGHNRGNDLADPAVIEAKRQLIETMIEEYGLSHQAVDLTEYWQNLDETTYSSPCDNVYRKAVLARNMMNDIVSQHPEYEIKVTSEVDIYPTQGDRNTELLHLPYNGWLTTTGAGSNLEAIGMNFGHLPLSSIYFGGEPTSTTAVLYAMLCGRNVKSKTRPDKWKAEDLGQMRRLNDWRHNPRVQRLTDGMMRPVFLGEGWDGADASKWKSAEGPYMWMYVDDDRTSAWLIASNGDKTSTAGERPYPLRWLSPNKRYAVCDVTLDDNKTFTYAFKTCADGSALNTQGLSINLMENSSSAKAFWIQEVGEAPLQVVFADDKVKQWSEQLQDGKLRIEADGEPGTEGLVMIYGTAEDDAMHLMLSFDETGHAEAEVTEVVNNDIAAPGAANVVLRYEFENYHEGLVKSNPAIKENAFFNGNPDSEGGYSSVMQMTAVGDYVIYTFPLPMTGRYQVTLNYKTSKSSRGEAEFFFLNADGTETSFARMNQSTTTSEKMVTLNAGTYALTEEGRLRVKMQLVGGTGKLIGANYLKLQRVP